jgi:ABC-type glycerol-3-phosphate transport system permease component
MGMIQERKTLYNYTIYALLTLGALFMLLPLVYMAFTAFKPLGEILTYPPRFFVVHPTHRNFVDLAYVLRLTKTPFTRYVFNSIVVVGATVTLTIFICTLAAYALAKHPMPGRHILFFIVITGLMFSPQVTLIPRYMLLNDLKWLDTYRALIVPSLASSYALFLMKQFIEPIPNELMESAKMDGASEWRIFWSVIMPLCKPAWATLTIFIFTLTWNDFVSPLVFVKKDAMLTLPVVMSRVALYTGQVERLGAVGAAAFLMVIPTIIVFILLQRHVIETMVYSGLKG